VHYYLITCNLLLPILLFTCHLGTWYDQDEERVDKIEIGLYHVPCLRTRTVIASRAACFRMGKATRCYERARAIILSLLISLSARQQLFSLHTTQLFPFHIHSNPDSKIEVELNSVQRTSVNAKVLIRSFTQRLDAMRWRESYFLYLPCMAGLKLH
jgi:hypothetical protein